jgi:PII-like signaling protein
MSSDLPLLIECVDTVQKIEGIMPVLDQMIGDGLVTTQGVEVRVYRGSEGTSDG